MRIISGRYRGKHIVPDNRLTLRPTTDFAKEGLFNILANRFDFQQLDVLDLFAGTGSISYEFASRGEQASIHAVDMENRHVMFIRNTARRLHLGQIRVVRDDVFHFLTICKAQYDIIFADPPYDMTGVEELPGLVFGRNLLKPEGIFVLEHSRQHVFTDHPQLYEHRNYGNVHFSFFGQSSR